MKKIRKNTEIYIYLKYILYTIYITNIYIYQPCHKGHQEGNEEGREARSLGEESDSCGRPRLRRDGDR